MKLIREQQGQDVEIELAVVGKKGLGYMKFAGMTVDHPLQLGDEPTYEAITDIARNYRTAFMEKKIDGLYVVYMRFHSTSKQSADVTRILPASAETNHNGSQTHADFEFTPTAEELLKELLPESVTVSLYQCFIDAVVSEHVSRMVAMKSATDNANDMIKQLGRLANRARQTQITSELSELIGGAEGLK
jgi:F-type H+-transporting ATPase subunit gamma